MLDLGEGGLNNEEGELTFCLSLKENLRLLHVVHADTKRARDEKRAKEDKGREIKEAVERKKVSMGPMRGWFGINCRESVSVWQMRRKNHRGTNEMGCDFKKIQILSILLLRGALIIKCIVILYFVTAPYCEYE